MRQMLIPLRKVDQAQRMVYGTIDETPDRSGEVFDYVSSKPYFRQWSEAMQNASQGRNFGNVRAMHGNTAAGFLTALNFDDAARRIDLAAYIADDAEWAKVQAGVYTGFSPGGRYVRQWNDGPYTRYTAEPSEISIVDLPCIPSATFTMVKIDGATSEVAFGGKISPLTPLYSAAGLASLLGTLGWLYQTPGWLDGWGTDLHPCPDLVKSWLRQGAALLLPLVGDGGLIDAPRLGFAGADPDGDGDFAADWDGNGDAAAAALPSLLAGLRGRPLVKLDGDLVQLIHDCTLQLGAVCPACAAEQVGVMAADDTTEPLEKTLSGAGRGAGQLAGPDPLALLPLFAPLPSQLQGGLGGGLQGADSPPPPVLRAFGKGEDLGSAVSGDALPWNGGAYGPDRLEHSLEMIRSARPQMLRR